MNDNHSTSIQLDTGHNGTVTFASDVVAIIAGLAATEVEGVAGMTGGFAGGIAEILGKKNLTKGVKVEVGNEEAAVDLFLILDYGVHIPETSKKIQENVKKSIETMTGLRCVEINIHIQGISFEKETKEIMEQPEPQQPAPPPPPPRVK